MNKYIKLTILICALALTINIQNSYATEKNDSMPKETQSEEDDTACKLEIDFTKIAETKPEIDCDDDDASKEDTQENSSNKKHTESTHTKKN